MSCERGYIDFFGKGRCHGRSAGILRLFGMHGSPEYGEQSAFALFRESCSLVAQGVVGVEDLDAVVQASMGPRWTVAGPFKSYHAGGGEGGLGSFMNKIGGTVQECWDASDKDVKAGGIVVGALFWGKI